MIDTTRLSYLTIIASDAYTISLHQKYCFDEVENHCKCSQLHPQRYNPRKSYQWLVWGICQNIPDLMSLCFLFMCFKLNTKLTFLSKRRLLSTSRVVNAVPSPTARAVNANLKSIIVSTLLDVFFSSISAAHASTGQ